MDRRPARVRDRGLTSVSRIVSAIVVAACGSANGQPAAPFAQVEALFAQRCVVCHSGPHAASSLRLDSHAAVMAGSARGPVIKPGDSAASELVRRVKGQSQPRMPMTGPPWLTDDEVRALERWIDAGALPGAAAAAPGAAPGATIAASMPGPGEQVTWVHVAPLFAQRCAKCHADRGQMGPPPEGYRLTSLAAALDASERARIVPGRPEASELLRRIRGQALPRMPLDGPPYLAAAEVELVQRWIEQGARGADGLPSPLPVGAAVRLHGTLQQGQRLDELTLSPGPRARLEKAPAPGRQVEVRGRVDAQGGIVVERIRGR
jgi:uncharacterized membrane protein